jgi:Kef-type K+ transport system membrane component KefB
MLAVGFGFSLVQSAFIGLTLTATSVSISAQVLLELGLLRSREGLALLGAAVVDDVLVILLLSFFVATQGAGGAEQIIAVIGRMLLFGAIALGVGIVLPQITARIKRLPITEGVLAWAIVVTLLYAWAAEEIGQLAAITGAFTVGIFFGRTAQRQEIIHGMHALAYAFFVPLFLVSIGLKADIRQLQGSVIGFTLLFVLIAMVSKLVGSGLGARLAGMTGQQSVRVGAGMISRGEVGLIVATVGLQRGLIGTDLFSVVVVMVLATTLVTPILLRWLFSSREVAHVSEPARIGD